MATIILDPQPIPLTVTHTGGLRIANTRIPLELVLDQYQQGMTAYEIVSAYDTLQLADVYAVLSYYHNNEREVEAYLAEVKARSMARQADEGDEAQAFWNRIRARKETAQSQS